MMSLTLGSRIKAAARAQGAQASGKPLVPSVLKPLGASRGPVLANASQQTQGAASGPLPAGWGPNATTAGTAAQPAAASTAVAAAPAAAAAGGSSALLRRSDAGFTTVRFWLKFRVEYGQSIRVVGGSKALGSWEFHKAPALRWSEGDLWHAELELDAGAVYEYKYVVVNGDGPGATAAAWQNGGNGVIALAWGDKEVEVYDNWSNSPGAMVVTDGKEGTREDKLLAWAGDYSAQRAELTRTKAELAQARQEIRTLRAEVGVRRAEAADAEGRNRQLEGQLSELRRQLESGRARTRATLQEATRLLDLFDGSATAAAGAGEEKQQQQKSEGATPQQEKQAQQQQQQASGGSGGGFFDVFSGLGGGRAGKPAAGEQQRPSGGSAAAGGR